MFGLTVRERMAAIILIFLMVLGGTLLFIGRGRHNKEVIATSTVDEEQIYVHICGAVAKPGLIKSKPVTRVFEIIEKAGGILSEANVSQVNLAKFVEDGERIYIPKAGEAISVLNTEQKSSSRRNSNKNSQKNHPFMGRLNLNLATAKQLERITGIGPSLAQNIINYRNQIGKFTAYEQLLKVTGIGASKLEKFRPYLYVE